MDQEVFFLPQKTLQLVLVVMTSPIIFSVEQILQNAISRGVAVVIVDSGAHEETGAIIVKLCVCVCVSFVFPPAPMAVAMTLTVSWIDKGFGSEPKMCHKYILDKNIGEAVRVRV